MRKFSHSLDKRTGGFSFFAFQTFHRARMLVVSRGVIVVTIEISSNITTVTEYHTFGYDILENLVTYGVTFAIKI